MRTLTLIAATVLFCTTAFAQEKTAPVKEAVPTSMQKADDGVDERRALSGELKNSVGMAEQLMTKMKGMDVDGNTMEDIKATHASLMEQLRAVNEVKGEDTKAVFERAKEINKGAMESLANYKAKLLPESK